FVSVGDGDHLGGLDGLRVNRLWQDVPLLRVSGPGKPRVRRHAHLTSIDQQTSVGYVFNFHEFRESASARKFAIRSVAATSSSLARNGMMAQRLSNGTRARSDQQAITEGFLAP